MYQLPETGYLRQAQLIPVIVPVSAATLWRWVKAGKFPAPVKLSERVTAWSVESVRAWLESHKVTA
jgi:prophage regulatory protein